MPPESRRQNEEWVIYERSMAEALSEARNIDTLDTDYGEMLVACGSRNGARSYYAIEYGVAYMDVLAKREWLRVDLGAIEDLAREMAEDPENYAGDIAYTWNGEGWAFENCKRSDEGAIGFWRCWERPNVPSGGRGSGAWIDPPAAGGAEPTDSTSRGRFER